MSKELDFKSEAAKKVHARIMDRVISSPGLRGSHPNKNLLTYLGPGTIARLLYLNLLYQKIVDVPGVILEFGVQYGAGMTTMGNLRAVYEPYNHTRRVIGFDTFSGFPHTHSKDQNLVQWEVGDFAVAPGTAEHIEENLRDMEELCGFQSPRFQLVKGDISETLPMWLEQNQGTLIALAIIDVDLYLPTKAILRLLKHRMAKGAVVAFDEISEPAHPGETVALCEEYDLSRIRLHRSGFQDNCGYFIVGE